MIVSKVIRYQDTNSVEVTWVENGVPVRCQSYADVQMDELAADLGASLAQYAQLIATVKARIVPKPPAPRYVPYSVPKAKAKIVLAAAGKLAPLLAYIDSLPDDDRNKIAFLDIADWERDSPTLIALAKEVLGLTDTGIDDFFIAADAEIL